MARKKAAAKMEDEDASSSLAESLESSDDSDQSHDDEHESSSNEDGDEEGGEYSDGEEQEQITKAPAAPTNIVPSSGATEQCTFDLGNLLAHNTHQLNPAQVYDRKSNNSKLDKTWYSSTTIEGDARQLPRVNEDLLLRKAAEGTTQLLRELWKLPIENTDVGPMAKLPSVETKLPRALPPPPPKQMTKWEQFARERGIGPKSKRSRKVFDEATGEWKYLTGSVENKANAGPESWPIIEVKKNDDPMQDPWERLREEKKTRVGKNTEARMRNAERSGQLTKGSANKMVKNQKRLEKQRELTRETERKNGITAPAGVPTDFGTNQKRGKNSTQLALKATQTSTASLGRFDKMLEGEPERKKQLVKKRKVEGEGTNSRFIASEAEKSNAILSRVMNGSKEKERDVKRGRYAKGETAYDYEFNDGLGAGSFKKKKGRAGMGKMRKMTKKRIT